MEKIEFYGLEFILDGRAELVRFGNRFHDFRKYGAPLSFVQAQVAGENNPSHAGVKAAFSSEGNAFRHVSHQAEGRRLTIVP